MKKKNAKKKVYGGKDSDDGVKFDGLADLADTGLPKVASPTGALRQVNPVEAGRYDLIPASVLDRMNAAISTDLQTAEEDLVAYLAGKQSEDYLAYFAASLCLAMGGRAIATHRLAVHFAHGAKKYADRQWEKGQETGRIVDSMLRHLNKFQRGLDDEDHAAACLWNAVALMWTEDRIHDGRLPKELDTYGLCRGDE